VQPRRINHVGAANKGENQVGASEQGFRGVCAIRLWECEGNLMVVKCLCIVH